MKRQVFYSFDYDRDVFRVQLIRQIGKLEGNTQVTANKWEELQLKGDSHIKSWIDENLRYRSCLIVLIGERTANRKWVQYEIKKAKELEKPMFGIYIHNVRALNSAYSPKGSNPFSLISHDVFDLGHYVKTYNPNGYDAYNDIRNNISSWTEEAIKTKHLIYT